MSSGVTRVFSKSSKRIEPLAPEMEKIISPSEPIQELADGFGGPLGPAEGPVWWKEGGYLLARPPAEITMDEVVLALEGHIAPMDCFFDDSEGRVLCSHHDDEQLCATKLLWTRVQLGVIKSLQRTTLAELVDFSAGKTSLPTEIPGDHGRSRDQEPARLSR